MRIAFIGGFAFSPKGTMHARAHPLGAELVKLGHEVTMFLPPYDNAADRGREWIQEGVRIRNVGKSHSSGEESAKKSDAKVYRREYPRLLFELIRDVNRYQPDVIHVFKPKGFAGVAGAYFLYRGTRLVLDCDDWEGWGGWNDLKTYPWAVKEYIDRQERWMMRKASAITAASKTLENRAAEIREQRRGVYYLPNCGASAASREQQNSVRLVNQSQTRMQLGLPDQPTILYSGHSEEADGLSSLVRAILKANRQSPVSIVSVGDAVVPRDVCQNLNSQPLISCFVFPRLPYEEFIRLVWASDIAALLYSNDAVHRAKCSARIVDYMAMGKPVITSALGQNLEYIVNGHSGILIPPDDNESLTDNLILLLHDPGVRLRIGQNAAARVKDKFQWNGEPLQNCLAAYRQVLN